MMGNLTREQLYNKIKNLVTYCGDYLSCIGVKRGDTFISAMKKINASTCTLNDKIEAIPNLNMVENDECPNGGFILIDTIANAIIYETCYPEEYSNTLTFSLNETCGDDCGFIITDTSIGVEGEIIFKYCCPIPTSLSQFENDLGFIDMSDIAGKEDLANKAVDFSIVNDTKYPTVKAVQDQFNALPVGLSLGETSTTAYRGDRGKVAYDHSQLTSGNPHNVTKSDIGLGNVDNTKQIPLTDKGANNGVAELDSNGKIPVSQLPSYVSDVETYPTLSSLPATGVDNIIYITVDTNLTYRWTGSAYVEISPSIALGETSSTAYRGDRGKIAYDHSQLTSGNPHNVTKTGVGLSNVDNTSDANKPISTATQNALNGKVSSVTGVSGVPVNNTDPKNPKIGLQDRLPNSITNQGTNETPQWYFTNFPFSTVVETKTATTVNSPLGADSYYVIMETTTPYNSSINIHTVPIQKITNNRSGRQAIRYAIDDTTWSPWVEVGKENIVYKGRIERSGGSLTVVPYINNLGLTITTSKVGTTHYVINGFNGNISGKYELELSSSSLGNGSFSGIRNGAVGILVKREDNNSINFYTTIGGDSITDMDITADDNLILTVYKYD